MSTVLKFRKTENLHVLFWLVKDACWVSDMKIAGMIMIIPTLSIAIWMCFRTREEPAELIHNLAIACWISANSIWMTGEFFYQDSSRPIAMLFFGAGLLVLVIHYSLVLYRNLLKKSSTMRSDN